MERHLIRKKLIQIAYLIFISQISFLLSTITLSHAQSFAPEMQITSTPNPVGSGARALGTGGAFIAIADDATAASWNPGALLNLKRSEISIVASHFSGSREYESELMHGQIDDLSHSRSRLNYFSIAFPFMLSRRNMVFSLNYQHLYEFSQDFVYDGEEPMWPDMFRNSHRRQKGSLNTLSPALAIQVVPPYDFYLGVTFNFWLDEHLENHWESYNKIQMDGIFEGKKIKYYHELYERYEFSGLDIFNFKSFNINIGALWRINKWFSLGGVIKTPFKADIKMEHKEISYIEYPDNPTNNQFPLPINSINDLTLIMPLSYGLGGYIRFSDEFSIALDFYRIHWEDYLIYDSEGIKKSPINNEEENLSNIKPVTQVRLGFEYLAYNERIPVRAGIFYDPEPKSGGMDDFYGASLGVGLIREDYALDIAYQYRFGNKTFHKFIGENDISSNVKQHYLYAAIIHFW